MHICPALLLLVLISGTQAKPQHNLAPCVGGHCPWIHCLENYYLLGNQCFQLVKAKRDWTGAQDNCISIAGRGQGGRLAIPNDLEAFSVYFLGQQGARITDFWLGGSDIASPGVWKWNDGSLVNSHDWAPGQPTCKKCNHCIEMNTASGARRNILWNKDCKLELSYICQSNVQYGPQRAFGVGSLTHGSGAGFDGFGGLSQHPGTEFGRSANPSFGFGG